MHGVRNENLVTKTSPRTVGTVGITDEFNQTFKIDLISILPKPIWTYWRDETTIKPQFSPFKPHGKPGLMSLLTDLGRPSSYPYGYWGVNHWMILSTHSLLLSLWFPLSPSPSLSLTLPSPSLKIKHKNGDKR